MIVTLLPPPAVIPHPALERARLRRRIGDLVERLIAMMDDLSGDPDLEDGADDEPSLSAGVPRVDWLGSQIGWVDGRGDDEREVACEDEGAEHDGREPDGHD